MGFLHEVLVVQDHDICETNSEGYTLNFNRDKNGILHLSLFAEDAASVLFRRCLTLFLYNSLACDMRTTCIYDSILSNYSVCARVHSM